MATLMWRLLSISRAAFAWWCGELSGLVPARLRRRLVRRGGGCLVLSVDGMEVGLCHEFASGTVPLATIDAAGTEARQKIAQVLRQAGLIKVFSRKSLPVCLRLPTSRALRHVLELPAAAQHTLADVVSFEIDRQTPFKAQDVSFAFRVLGRDVAAQRLQVEITAVSRRVVTEAMSAIEGLGLMPDRIEVAGRSPELAASRLLLDGGTSIYARSSRRVNIALATSASILAALAIILPVYASHTLAESGRTQLAEGQRKAAELARLQAELDALRDDGMFLVNRKRRGIGVSEILAEVARTMPDNTWIIELQLSGSEMHLAGFSASASDLIGLLEKTRIFRNSVFRSPVTRDPVTQRERFHIAARVLSEAAQ
jgi:general secretion pathway protein L